MHDYSTDSSRKSVVFALFGISALVAKPVQDLVAEALKSWPELSPYLSAPSPLALAGALYWIFDVWGWRAPQIGHWITGLPDLRGTWRGKFKIPGGEGGEPRWVDAVFVVQQTWTQLSVRILAENGTADSQVAALNVTQNELEGLHYQYRYWVAADAPGGKHAHAGTCHLRLEPDGRALRGDFYTGRDKQNIGTVHLRRVSRAALSREEALTLPEPEGVLNRT